MTNDIVSGMQTSGLTVAVVDENQMRAAILEEGLIGAGVRRVVVIANTTSLLRQLADIEPDVVIIDLENPSRDVLEQMFQVSRLVARPVAMFVDRSDGSMIQAAMDAGVSAYVVDGLKKERVKPVMDVAISRFNTFHRLQQELEKARNELAERKVIERAKGILMNTRGMTEEAAYSALRRQAMSDNRRIIDIAQSVVTASKLLG